MQAFVNFILKCMDRKQTLSVRWVHIEIITTINYAAYFF
jgi:hypothetical protein